GEKVGPNNYIAPEMLENAEGADGRPADVFSLGKLLWKLATGYNFPLPGVHIRTVPALTISSNVTALNTSTLDALLEAMTQIEPAQRPIMDHVARELVAWCAPSPAPVRATDLRQFTKRAHGLVDSYAANQRRRAVVQETADNVRNAAFQEFRPVL